MPKRRNPFSDIGPLQLKTHVGVKELANGTMHEELMKEVYERTQGKLFGAMKRNSDLNANHMQSRMDLVPSSAVDWGSRVDPQQMKLDGEGHVVCPTSGWNGSLAAPQDLKQNGMQFGSIMSHHADFKFGLVPNPVVRMPSPQGLKFVTDGQCGQMDSCGDFSSWMHSDGAVFRQQSPPTSMPATGGQLCLDLNGHLTAPLHSSMDCDTDHPQPPVSMDTAIGVGGRPMAGGGGRGLERWGFLSANASAPKVRPESASVKCQTCRHVPSSTRCHFCERHLCGGCGRQCDSCSLLFCTLCSTLDYNTSMERAFCLSCAG